MRLPRLFGTSLLAAVAASCLFGGSPSVFAQQGTSSSSVTRARTLATDSSSPSSSGNSNRIAPSSPGSSGSVGNNSRNSYAMPRAPFLTPDVVAVEEFVNYHKHRLPLPKVGQAVAMDARWGNDRVSSDQPEAVLQIGLATAEVNDRADLRPLNLALVIDKSGSMQAADKMSRVKDALLTMFGQLRAGDIVSIVVFDTNAQVMLPARTVGDGRELRRAVAAIQPGGSTNLNAGLTLGYGEAMKNYRAGATNRVILLTDGIANQGITDPRQIAENSRAYNEEGVDLSTIGVGVELDQDLLRTLAKSGRGLFHFVAENEDIEKVFVREVQSLMSPVARHAVLEIGFSPQTLDLIQVYGYNPQAAGSSVKIPLDDMNSGLTAVVLLKFRAKNFSRFIRSGLVARLSYYDIRQGRTVQQTQTVTLDNRPDTNGGILADVEVKKNYTIALLAQSLADLTEAAGRGEYRRAETLLNAAVGAAYRNYPTMEDKDIRFVLDIVENYQRNLRAYLRDDG
jgi:Ca-activated chloride channel family protein